MPRMRLPRHHHRGGLTAIRRVSAVVAAGLLSACAVGVSAEPIAARPMNVTSDVTRGIECELTEFSDFEDGDAPGGFPPSRSPELTTLNARARARHPAILRLLDAGKIGETWEGELEPVRAGCLDEPVDAATPDGGTIQGLLEDENQARLRVYELIARGEPVSAAEVGICNGARAFARAAPEHYLKPKGCDWAKRKDLHPDDSTVSPGSESARSP